MEIDRIVENKARSVGADTWLAGLDALATGLAEEWGLVLGESLRGGTEAAVLAVSLADGSPAVLKLCVPRPGRAAELEALVLDVAGGHGCARLLRADVERGALLIERLGPSMFDLGVPYAERIPALCDLAAAVWRPVPTVDVPTGADKGRQLIGFIEELWERLDQPCPRTTVDHAITCARRRVAAHRDDAAVLVHGDVHQWNALQTLDGTAFRLVDPDGLLADPAYDLGILMREDPTEGDLVDRATFLSERTGVDRTAIWEWGVVERLSTALLCIDIDLQPSGDEMLAAANRCAIPGA